MAKTAATMTLPILTRISGKELEIGTLDLEVRLTASGKLVAPTAREIRAALRKAKAR